MKWKVVHVLFCVALIIANMWLLLLPERAMWGRVLNILFIIWFSYSFWDSFKKLETKEE